MEENYDEDEDEAMDEDDDDIDEEGEMEYDESESDTSSHTQPDESEALENALAGGEIEEPADGWQDIDEDMNDEGDEGDEDEDDLDEEDRNEEEMMWEVRCLPFPKFSLADWSAKGGINDNGGNGLLVDEQDDDDEGEGNGMVDGDDQTGEEDEIDMFSAADECVSLWIWIVWIIN